VPFEAGFIVERSFFRIIANVPNDRGRGFAHTRHATLRSVTKQRHNNRAATMPGDNAAPPTQPRTESIVCTSLVLLSSPALPRRSAQGTGGEEPGGIADNGGDGRRICDVTTSQDDFA